MKIEGLAVAFPSRTVTNNDVLSLIEERSAALGPKLPKALRVIGSLLEKSGSGTRRWCGEGETSLSVTLAACRRALAQAGGDVDLVIYASVYPELNEPATASLIAHQLKLDTAKAFDVKMACDGWMRAVEVAELYLKAGRAKRVLVVNGEFVMRPGFGLFPDLFALTDTSELEFRIPAYTIGEAATATVLTPDGDDWRMTNTTQNGLYDLCTITVPWQEKPSVPEVRVGKNGPGCFTSYGAQLHKLGYPYVEAELAKAGVHPEDVDAFFTHSSSWEEWSEFADLKGFGEQFHDIYREFGNCVSAAVPAAMAMGFERGTLKRGHRVLALVGSAGMSFSTVYFTY